MPHDGQRRWRDAQGYRKAPVDRIEVPDSVADVRAIVAGAFQNRKRVRMDAAGHSFSDIAVPRDVLIDPRKLDDIALVGPRRVRVGTGVRIRDLNRFLVDHQLAMPNLGSYDAQTLPGAIGTGTHGSGIALGGLPDTVRAIDLVDGTGALHHLTAADGDAFLAATCSLGALGLVVALELEVVPTYDLAETAELATWDELKPRLLDGSLLQEARCVEVMIAGYRHTPDAGKYRGQNVRAALVVRRALTAQGHRRHGHRPLLADVALLFGGLTADVALDAVGNPAALARLHYQSCAYSAESEYVDRWDKCLLQDLSNFPARSVEIGVPVDRCVAAVEAVLAKIDDFAEAGWWHTSPLNLRFVAASANTLMAMYSGRATCMIEIPQITGTPGAEAMFVDHERLLIERFEGRPHWGKVHNLVGTQFPLEQVHPNTARFRAIRAALDPRGVFANAMTDRIRL